MDPRTLDAGDWRQIARAIELLVVFAGLTVDAVVAFLLAHAVIPSLLRTEDAPPLVRRFRAVFYPIGAVGLVGAIAALAAGLWLAFDVAWRIYPRQGL